MGVLILNAEIYGVVSDVSLSNGRIERINPTDGRRSGREGLPRFDAKGGALLPGLHDHHIHLNATAAAMNSVRCGPPEILNEADLIEVLNAPTVGADGLRGVGYHPSVAGEIDRDWLDRFGPNRPVRIQHRSGRLWILNSLALRALSLAEPKDGRLYDQDVTLRVKTEFPDLQPLIKRLIAYGITGVTEVTPSNGLDEYQNYVKSTQPLRLSIMGTSELSAAQSHHLKLHYHDHDLPALELLSGEIKAAHDCGRNIAAHCVTRAELMLTLAALEIAGPVKGDRIEHAAIADDVVIDWMKKLGVIIVTQPNFIAERQAAYVKEVPVRDHGNLWRLKSFMDVKIPCAAGSDAPFGDPNPWAAMAAAAVRPAGFEDEAISAEAALALYTKPVFDAGGAARTVAVGAVADLCLLDRPWSAARENLSEVLVQATWIDGVLVYNRVD